jgi:hypothetical protein
MSQSYEVLCMGQTKGRNPYRTTRSSFLAQLTPRIRAGIGPKPTISLRKWQSGPSPGTPRDPPGEGGAMYGSDKRPESKPNSEIESLSSAYAGAVFVNPAQHGARQRTLVGALWALIKIYIFLLFGGSKSPSKVSPRGPELTPRARQRGPRTNKIKNDVRHALALGHHSRG